jgi:hypothetical protein
VRLAAAGREAAVLALGDQAAAPMVDGRGPEPAAAGEPRHDLSAGLFTELRVRLDNELKVAEATIAEMSAWLAELGEENRAAASRAAALRDCLAPLIAAGRWRLGENELSPWLAAQLNELEAAETSTIRAWQQAQRDLHAQEMTAAALRKAAKQLAALAPSEA